MATSDKKRDDFTIEMGIPDKEPKGFEPRSSNTRHGGSSTFANNPIFPVLSYCGSSILMTVMNKYVLSGTQFNLNFFLLLVQVLYSFIIIFVFFCLLYAYDLPCIA